MDRAQWTIAPYTEADLQSQIDNAPDAVRRRKANRSSKTSTNSSPGINAYVDEALIDPNKLPAEYAALGKVPTEWKPTDVIAEASLIGGIFGKGGGAEVRSALALEAFEKQFGKTAGQQGVEGLPRAQRPRGADDRQQKRSPTRPSSPFAKTGLAMPDPGSVSFVQRRLLRRRAAAPRGERSTDTPGAAADPQRRLDRLAAAARRARRPRAMLQLGARQREALDATATRSP